MLYEYKCKFCHDTYTIYKPINRLQISELCPRHDSIMDRVFSFNGQISTGTFKPGYYTPFGKTFTTKGQLQNELSRIKHETGKEMIEVGNDQGFSRPERKSYEMKDAVQALRKEHARNYK